MKRISRREFVHSAMSLLTAGVAAMLCGFSMRTEEAKDDQPMNFEPNYLKLYRNGELRQRGQDLWEMMRSCEICPRRCGAKRLEGEEGFCHASSQLEISSFYPHYGEERPLVGRGGSGTIFLTNCSLRCVFCINWEISHAGEGHRQSIDDMAEMMLILQEKKCSNINFVTPTHYLPHIILAVEKAAAKGLRLPLVYNTCGWERLEILQMLDGIMDVYLPDFKYSSSEMSATYSAEAKTYPEITQRALLEMHRQVGTAQPDTDGVIRRGLMIRHLVMPNNVSGTKEVVEWIATHLPKETYVNVMSQYTPMYKAFNYPQISRRINRKEYAQAIQWAKEAGLTNLEIQGFPRG